MHGKEVLKGTKFCTMVVSDQEKLCILNFEHCGYVAEGKGRFLEYRTDMVLKVLNGRKISYHWILEEKNYNLIFWDFFNIL